MEGSTYFIKCIRKINENDFNKLWVNHSGGTYYLFNKQMNGCQGMVLRVGAYTVTIKLTMAGT